jgi:hypothetical protein
MKQHTFHSSYREKLIEHLFIGALLKYSWTSRNCALAIAKPEVDNLGYDVLAEEGDVVRHIQLKTAFLGSTTKNQKVHTALALKPAGCLVWILFDELTLELGPYLFFGGKSRERLCLKGLKIAKHVKANTKGVKAERPSIRVVPKASFRKYETISALYDELFASA